MPPVFISSLDAAEVEPAEHAPARIEGAVEVRRVLGGADRPLHLWAYRLEPGAALHWPSADEDRALFLWEGEVSANGQAMRSEATVIVEHGGTCEMRAGQGGCTLLEFVRAPGSPPIERRPGGRVHGMIAAEAPTWRQDGVLNRLYADSGCPTCQIWLHESGADRERQSSRHYHTTDEIIVVKAGAMQFGTRKLPRGSVLAIDRNAVYSFSNDAEGAFFINFRAEASFHVEVGKSGRGAPRDEQALLRARVQAIPHEVSRRLDRCIPG